MKKLICFIGVLALLAALAGCGSGQRNLLAEDFLVYQNGLPVDPAPDYAAGVRFSILQTGNNPPETHRGAQLGSTADAVARLYIGYPCTIYAVGAAPTAEAGEEPPKTEFLSYLEDGDVAASYQVVYTLYMQENRPVYGKKEIERLLADPAQVATSYVYSLSFYVEQGNVNQIYVSQTSLGG